MTTLTWSASTLTALWSDATNWTTGGPPSSGRGEAVVIGYGTVDLDGTAQYDITTTLQPVLHALGVTLAATNVDFGDNSLLIFGPAATPGQPTVLDVIGSGMLDDANTAFGVPPSAGTIEFWQVDTSLVNLTIELSPGAGQPPTATFTNDGAIRGDDLTIAADAGTAATFYNNATIEIGGGLTVDADVTLDGTGIVDLVGSETYASIAGPVGAGETIGFNGGVQNTLTIGDISAFQGTVDITHESQIVVQGVSLVSFSNSEVTFSDGSTLDVVPTGSGGNVDAETVPDGTDPETLIDATESGNPCFCAGTRIALAEGEVPVEQVRAGDNVRLARGGMARVAWVGQRLVRCDRHPRPHDVWPVRVGAGAFTGIPRRDVWLSPDHAVSVAGRLIPVRHLVNGASIVQARVPVARYHHVELARHDLLLAEGLAVESYLDTGNRAAFVGGGPASALHPDFSRRVWAEAACAPLVEHGPVLAAARLGLLRQATRLGHRRTRDPRLALFADGRALRTESSGLGGWHVRLPAGAREVQLRSRVWVPAEMRPEADDTRRLGVAIGRLWLDGREVSLDSPALTTGWHAAEPGARWTDGDATLVVAGARTLGFVLAMAGSYWRDGGGDASGAAQIGSRSPQR